MTYTENHRIRDLLGEFNSGVTPRAHQFFIEDPEAWYQNVGNDFDKSRKRNALRNL